MYQPTTFQETRPDVLHALMRDYPLATLFTLQPDAQGLPEPQADLVPFLLETTADGDSTRCVLKAHLARNNPAAAALAQGATCLVVFQGPQHYVSPSWYPSKAEGGKVVPTWNYATVHAWGHARMVDDAPWLMRQIAALTDTQEATLPHPWAVTDAPADYLATMVRGIVGIEIEVERLQGKWKVSQNRPVPDRAGVYNGLQGVGAAQRSPAQAMAALVAQHLPAPAPNAPAATCAADAPAPATTLAHPGLTIRAATPADHAAWWPLWQAYLRFYESALPDAVSDLTWQRLMNPAEPMHLALAELNGQVVGMVHFIEHRSCWTPGNYVYLQDLYTHESTRGQGVGRALIEHVYAQARAMGCSRVHWLTQEGNTTARLLYDRIAQRSGFIQYRQLL